jgi:trehalose 6-phosphate phosphatase
MNSLPTPIERPGQLQGWNWQAPAWLFLDYDGTLADFAPTPDHILPDEELIGLLESLARPPERRVMVISGRRLAHIQKLLPIPGILLAGSYGLEMQLPDGESLHRQDYAEVRPTLEILKPGWQALLDGQEQFYLEDKGWSLAIHARFAAQAEAEALLEQALAQAEQHGQTGRFRLLGGHKFLEICPALADKGKTLDFLLERYAWPQANLLYIGDDDKDEAAFEVIRQHGGQAVVVADQPRPSRANYRLASPQAVRRFLKGFIQPPAGGQPADRSIVPS